MRTYPWLNFALLLFVACSENVTRENIPESTGESRPALGGEAAGEDEAPEGETEPEAEPPEEPPSPADLEAAAADLEETVVDAIEAATLAETGSTYCESAFEGMAAMIARVAAQYPDDTRPVPPRLAFMAVCERLSQGAQQCLVPSYATEHVAECRVIAEAIPAEDLRRLEEVLTSQ
jgi:hypothetical protein